VYLARKYQAWLKKFAFDKHSSLFFRCVSDEEKGFVRQQLKENI